MNVSDSNHKMHRRAKGREVLIRELGIELNVLISASRAVMAEAAAGIQPSVSSSAFQVLLWLHSHGPAKASRIADAVAMDRSVVSRLTKQLGKLDLVEAEPDNEDGRGVVYVLTEAGRVKAADSIVRKGNLFEIRIAQWLEADLKHLTRLLRQFNGRI